jgi:hypothetical protein
MRFKRLRRKVSSVVETKIRLCQLTKPTSKGIHKHQKLPKNPTLNKTISK